MSNSNEVAIVTGSSTGIGFETALLLARKGYTTFATMRNLAKGQKITAVAAKENLPLHVVQLDVTDQNSIQKAIGEIVSKAGRIDVLVNNAGYGVGGAFEDTSIEEMKNLFETNVFGLARVMQAVLPTMRKQRSGSIVNISSGAGRLGYPGGSVYVSSKFAIEGLSESLSYEAEPFGIKVVLVEPGFIKTNFGDNMVFAKKAQQPDSPYSKMMQQMSGFWQQMLEAGSNPTLVAEKVAEALSTGDPELRYPAGKDVEEWLSARKAMSDREYRNMMKQSLLK